MLIYKKKSSISKQSRIYPFCKITNSVIDDYSYVNLFANINNTSIGKFCSISMNFKSGLGLHPINFLSSSPFFYSKKNALKRSIAKKDCFSEFKRVNIKNDVWVGADVIIMDGVSIGNGAIIGAKAVVTKDVPDYAIVGGVPGKIIKYRFSPEIIKELIKISWWDWTKERLERNNHVFSKELKLQDLKKIVK
ncbi:MAG: CatB-related O-acetyltransferase [Algibacter sp.]